MNDKANFIEFSKPFVEAARNIFKTMVGCALEAKKPSIKTDSLSRGDITAFIQLVGDFEKNGVKTPYRAMLVISFPYQTYFKVASAMLSETYTSYHPDIRDLGGELVNMIMGNAKRDLKGLGFTSNMAIPSLIEGEGHSIKYPTGTNVVLIPFDTVNGPIYMELCYASDA